MSTVTLLKRAGIVMVLVVLAWIPILNAATDGPSTERTSLKQQGVEVLLWKITFQDGGDDMLARLVIQEGKVAGFWFQ